MQDMSDNRKFKMGSDSGLFNSLLEAKNNSQEVATTKQADVEHEFEADEEQEDELDNQYQMGR